MSELNSQLKEYLSRNNKSNSEGLSTKSITYWFTKLPENKFISKNNNNSFKEAEEDPLIPALGKRQKIFGFIGCITMGILCFCLAGLYVPVLLFKARKFALLYTMGSLFVISRYVLSYIPGGQTGMKFFTKIFTSTVTKTANKSLPI
ncbi:protein transport protein sft2-like [Centruroides sculpturatus]|uniref:protein transport protein sft2-like n=1 Tax=Centruroides sculpturatus TaxID=218467 RepID=UPI000C6E6C4C|nr:protein transport protein sft2-like [Centruroides sculpturatus]